MLRMVHFTCGLGLLFSLGCSDSEGSMDESTTMESGATAESASLRADVVRSLGENVVLPVYEEFASRADSLVSDLDAYAAAPSVDTRRAAQDAWSRAIDLWQRAELMQLGPAAAADLSAGGEDFRDDIYAWPALNLCSIDQRTVGENYDSPSELAGDGINLRGLGAIEYLLFVDDSENRCSPVAAINADGSWERLSDQDIEQRRARHAHSLATLVKGSAEELVSRWRGDPEGGQEGFLIELTDPARSGAVYGSAQEALNAISNAMFYLDRETKDMKLGEPSGISMCDGETCPDSRESRFANRSASHVVENIRAFQQLFLGGAPNSEAQNTDSQDAQNLGFDDLLRDMGASDLSDQMESDIEASITAAEQIGPSLVEALSGDSVVAAHTALRRVTDELKSTFLSVLDLEAPQRAAGDND